MAHDIEPGARYALARLDLAIRVAAPGQDLTAQDPAAQVADAINARFNGDLAQGTVLAADWRLHDTVALLFAGEDDDEGTLFRRADALSATPPAGAAALPAPPAGGDAWRPFDYAAPPPAGTYWAVTHAPDFDLDVADDGRTIGRPTGKMTTSVVMLQIDVDPEGQLAFEPVDRWTFGHFSDEATVSHVMPVRAPAWPGREPSLGSRAPATDTGSPA